MSATFHILYPENRIVSTEWVLSQGFDAKVNAAVDEHVKANGVFPDGEEGDRAYSAFVAGIGAPDLEESIAILEDLGLVTFSRKTPEDEGFGEMGTSDALDAFENDRSV